MLQQKPLRTETSQLDRSGICFGGPSVHLKGGVAGESALLNRFKFLPIPCSLPAQLCQVTYLRHRPRQSPRRSKLPRARRDPKAWPRKNPSDLSQHEKSLSTCHVDHVWVLLASIFIGSLFFLRDRACGLVFVGYAVC